jgi:hypothetical protein
MAPRCRRLNCVRPSFSYDVQGVSWFVDVDPTIDITKVGPWYDINSPVSNAQYFADLPASPPNASLVGNFYTFAASSFDSSTLTITVGDVGVYWGWKEPLQADPAPVPEPSTLALMSLAVGALIVSSWRRRRFLRLPVTPAPVPSDQQPSRSGLHHHF